MKKLMVYPQRMEADMGTVIMELIVQTAQLSGEDLMALMNPKLMDKHCFELIIKRRKKSR